MTNKFFNINSNSLWLIISLLVILSYLPVNSHAYSVGYIYSSDISSANSYKSHLDDNGYTTTLISLNNVSAFDFSEFNLIIIGDDTGYTNSWGNIEAINKINGIKLPVIGVGEGGYAFFGKKNLNIGYGNGWHGDTNSIFAANTNHAIFKLPNKINIPYDNILKLYTASSHIGIYLPSIPQNIIEIGREINNNEHYPIAIEKQTNAIWGFTNPPNDMTSIGKALFINIVSYLTNQNIDNEITPPSSVVVLSPTTEEEIAKCPVVFKDKTFTLNFPAYSSPVDIYMAILNPDGKLLFVNSGKKLTTEYSPYSVGKTSKITSSFSVADSSFASEIYGQCSMYWLVAPSNGGDLIKSIDGAYELGGYGLIYETIMPVDEQDFIDTVTQSDSIGSAGSYNIEILKNAEVAQNQIKNDDIPNVVEDKGNLLILDIRKWPSGWLTGKIIVVRMPNSIVEYKRLIAKFNLTDGRLAIGVKDATLLEVLSNGELAINGNLSDIANRNKVSGKNKSGVPRTIVDIIDLDINKTTYSLIDKTDLPIFESNESNFNAGIKFSKISLQTTPDLKIKLSIDAVDENDQNNLLLNILPSNNVFEIINSEFQKAADYLGGVVSNEVMTLIDAKHAQSLVDDILKVKEVKEKLDVLQQLLNDPSRIKYGLVSLNAPISGDIILDAYSNANIKLDKNVPLASLIIPISGPLPLFLQFNLVGVASLSFTGNANIVTESKFELPLKYKFEIENGNFTQPEKFDLTPTFHLNPPTFKDTEAAMNITAGIQIESGLTIAKIISATIDPTAEIVLETEATAQGELTQGCVDFDWDLFGRFRAEAEAEVKLPPPLENISKSWDVPIDYKLYENQQPMGNYKKCWGNPTITMTNVTPDYEGQGTGTLTNPYRRGQRITLHWTSKNIDVDTPLIISMKRDMASSYNEPDGINWYRFSTNTPNGIDGGSARFQIPFSAPEADDWRFCVSYEKMGWDCTDQKYTISDVELSSLTISGAPQVDENSSASYTCTAKYSDGSTSDVTTSAAWSENSSYASISMHIGYECNPVVSICLGLVDPSSADLSTSSVSSDQTVIITATYGGKSATKDVIIKDKAPILSSITINGATQVDENSSASYTCTAKYSDGSTSDVTTSAAWSENSSYASISMHIGYECNPSVSICLGLVDPSSADLSTSSVSSDQTVIITATYGGKSDTHTVTIKNKDIAPTLTSISIECKTYINSSGVQYKCLATYSNGSTAYITNNATWSIEADLPAYSRYFSITNGYVSYVVGTFKYNNMLTVKASYGGKTSTCDVMAWIQ